MLKAKEEIMETQIFHHAKKHNLQKNPLPKKKTKSFKILL
jgi:hypothetical protein